MVKSSASRAKEPKISFKALRGKAMKSNEAIQERTRLQTAQGNASVAPERAGPIRIGGDCAGYGAHVVAMAQIGVDFKHVLHCELDRDLRYLSQVLFDRMGCPAYYMETDMVSRRPLAQPLDLYFLSTPCPTFSSAGKGEACSDPRGLLLLHGADKILTELPKAFVMENVSELNKRHRAILDDWTDVLKQGGYVIKILEMITSQHGLRQNRRRIFVCGVRADCFRGLPSSMNELQPAELFPPLPLTMFLDDDSDDRETLGEKKQNKTFKANMKKAKAALGINLRDKDVVVDVFAGQHAKAVRGYMPCITASRGASGGFYLPGLRRMTSMQELALQQGIEPALLNVMQGAGLSRRKLGHALGNSISINILERLLPRLLVMAGLLETVPLDIWKTAYEACDEDSGNFGNSSFIGTMTRIRDTNQRNVKLQPA